MKRKYLFIVLSFILMFLFLPTVVKAEDYNYFYEAYVCPDYTTDEAIEDDPEEAINSCALDFINGDLDDSQITSDKSLSPGTIFMVVQQYTHTSGGNQGYTFALKTSYSTDKITPIYAEDGALTIYRKKKNPTFGSNYTKFDQLALTHTNQKLSLIIRGTVNGVTLSEGGPVMFAFFKVNDDATGGTATIRLVTREEDSKNASSIATEENTYATYAATPLNLNIAGEALSTDSSLSSLTLTGSNNKSYTSQLGFTPGSTTKEYSIVVPYDVTSITLNATTTHDNAYLLNLLNSPKLKTDSKTFNLDVGDNNLLFSVQPEDPSASVVNYKVVVHRLNNVANLNTLTVKNDETEVGSLSGLKYSGEVEYAVETVDINAVISDRNGYITVDGTKIEGYSYNGSLSLPNYVYDSANGKNTRTIKVSAENCNTEYASVEGNTCTEKTYEVEIVRKRPSAIKTLSSLKVDDNLVTGFDPTTYTYDYGTLTVGSKFGVPANKDNVNITAELTDSLGSIVSGTGNCSLSVGPNTCEVVVKAQDPNITTQTYTVNIYKLSNENKLNESTLSITPYTGTTANSSLGTLAKSATESNTWIYSYDPTVTKMALNISVLDIVDGTAKATAILNDITGTRTQLTTSSNGVITYNNILPSISKLEIVVTAEDGTTNTYYINFSRGKSSDTSLKTLKISSSINNKEYELTPKFIYPNNTRKFSVTVDPEVTEVDVLAEANSVYAKSVEVTGNKGADNKGFAFGNGNTINVRVTAENETSYTDYEITVIRKKYTISDLTGLTAKVDDEDKLTYNASTTTYNINVDYDVTSIDIDATTNEDYVITVSGTGTKTLNTGLNTFVVHTQSQETGSTGTSKDYTINVTRAKNTDPSVSSVVVSTSKGNINGTCDNDTHICTLDSEVPNDFASATSSNVTFNFPDPPLSTDAARAVATITTTTINTTDSNGDNITNAVPVSIQVEDTTVAAISYTLNIVKEKSTNNILNTVTVTPSPTGTTKNCSLGSSTSCSIDVPVTTTGFTMAGTLPDSKATVTFATNDASQTGTTFTMPSNKSEMVIIATVTPESGTPTKTYEITVSRERSSNSELEYIKTDATGSMQLINDPFNASTQSYKIEVDGSTTSINIEAKAKDDKSTVTVTGANDSDSDQDTITVNKTLDYGSQINTANPNNTVKITVKAENNSTREYTIEIVRKHNTDGTLKELTVDGTTVNGFSAGDTSKTYTLSDVTYNTTSIEINAQPKDGLAKVTSITVNGNNQSITASNNVTKTVNLNTGENTIVITSKSHDENSANTQTYTIKVTREYNTDITFKTFGVKWDGVEHSVTCDASNECTLDDDLEVPYSFTTANISNVLITFNDPALNASEKATYNVTPTGLLTTDDDLVQVINEVPITVYSEYDRENSTSGTSFTLKLKRTRSDVKKLRQVNTYINGATTGPKTCNFSSTSCSIDVPTGTTTVRLEAVLDDTIKSRASFSIGSGSNLVTGPEFDFPLLDSEGNANGSLVVNVTVTAEDGTTASYVLTINRAASSDNKISELVVTDGDGNELTLSPAFNYVTNPTQQVFSLTVNDEISSVNIYTKAHDDRTTLSLKDTTLTDTNDSIAIIETTKNLEHDKNNQIVIQSKAQNNDSINYTINITRSRGTNPYLSSLTYDHSELYGTESLTGLDTNNYSHNMDAILYNTTEFDLSATLVDERATIDSIKVNGVMITVNTSIYNGVTTYSATPELKTGDNTIVITTKAHNTSITNTYTLNITRGLSSNKNISLIEVTTDDDTIEATCSDDVDSDGNTICYLKDTSDSVVVPHNMTTANSSNIEITFPSGKLSTDPKATATITSTALETTDSEGNTIVNKVPIKVTAEDGTTKDYVLHIERTRNNVKTLTRVDIYVGKNSGAIDETSIENYCVFDGTSTTCNISVPQATTSFKLVGTLGDPLKSVVSFKIGETINDTFEMLSVDSDSSKTAIATVTAEDGTTALYTININRQASNNSFLSSLKTNAKQSDANTLVSVPSFKDSTTEYIVEVEGVQNSIKIEAIAADERSKVTIDGETYELGTITDRITYTKSLNDPGENTTIVVVVQPEDGSTPRNYTITVKRKSSVDPDLSMIYINGRPIDEYMDDTFDGRNKDEYILNEFPYNTYNIGITADNYDTTYGKVKVNGTPQGTGVDVDLQTKFYNNTYPVAIEDEYFNVITVTGIAHDESVTKDYTLKVKRSPSDSYTISKVEVLYGGTYHEATCDLLNYRCTITVPNSVDTLDDTNVRVTPTSGNLSTDALATVTMGSTELSSTSTTNHKFRVTSEMGTHFKDYTLIVTREKSNNPLLNSILIYDITGENVIGSFNPSFSPNKPEAQQVYTVSVPVGTSAFRVYAEPQDEYATVTGATKDLTKTTGDYTLIESTKTVEVISRSQDNSASIKYTLNITRASNTDYKLGTISLLDQDNNEYNTEFDPDISEEIPSNVSEFNVTVPSDVTTLTFTVTPNNSLSSISYGTGTGIASPDSTDDNTAIYSVTSNKTYRIEVIVTSEAGADKPYYINVTVEPKSDSTLSSLTYKYSTETPTELIVDGATSPFDLGTVPNSTSKITLAAAVNDSTARISDDSDIGELPLTTSDDGNTFTITVIAEDNTETDYVIKVKREKSSVATLKSLNIASLALNETFASDRFNYTANVTEFRDEIKMSEVTPVKTDNNSTLSYGNLSMVNSGTYEYKIKVIAENGIDYNEYVITITKPKSTNDYLKEIELSTGTIDPTFDGRNIFSYTINVPQTASELTITGTPEVASATVSGNRTVSVVDGTTVTLSVQAEAVNPVPRTYTFTIKTIKSSVATLDDMSVSGHLFRENNGKFKKTSSLTTYTVADNLDNTVSKLKVNALPTNTDATIYYYKNSVSDSNLVCSGVGVNSCDIDLIPSIGKGYMLIRVVAADGITSKTYTIEYTKVKSSNNFLSDITPSAGSLNQPFNSATQIYSMDLSATTNSLQFELTAEDQNSSIKYVEGNTENLSSLTISLDDIPAGRTTITIEVTAEDQGNPRTYYIYLDKANATGNNDATIDSITITHDGTTYPVSPNVSAQNTIYDIGTIPFNITELTVTAVTHDGNATVKYAGPGEPYHDANEVTIPRENGQKSISIQVRAEDGTYKDYTVTYNKQADSNNFLSSLTVSGMTLDNAFDKNRGSYKVVEHLTADESSIVITAIKESENAIITIGGETYISGTNKTIQNLRYGKNTINILVTSEGGASRTYVIEVYRDSDQEMITSEEYEHTIEDGYIKTIGTEKKVTEIKDQLDNDNSKLEIWKADNSEKIDDDAIVGTGMIVKLFVDGTMIDSKIIIIMGDTTGDGKVNMNDVSRIINHYLKRNYLVDAPLIAADVTKDDKVNMNDVSRVINHYLKRSYIEYK